MEPHTPEHTHKPTNIHSVQTITPTDTPVHTSIGSSVSVPDQKRAQIENNFTYHAPKPGQPEKYTAIREKAKELALLIVESTPASREQSLAITELESCVMWANAGIARN